MLPEDGTLVSKYVGVLKFPEDGASVPKHVGGFKT